LTESPVVVRVGVVACCITFQMDLSGSVIQMNTSIPDFWPPDFRSAWFL